MYPALLFLHVLGATIWTGGHLVLALGILPGALRQQEPSLILDFESRYEKIGMPALVVQVATGIWLAHRLLPDWTQWFTGSDTVSQLLLIKITLLALTIMLALHARLRLIPQLGIHNLKILAAHIVAVTLLSILFVATGLGFRTGVLF